MKNDIQPRADVFLRERTKKHRWRKAVLVLSCVVVFLTTYLLIIPALTWERSLICTLPEHTHTERCYEEITIPSEMELVCQQSDHIHDASCYGVREYTTQKRLVCTLAEHIHTDSCYDASPPDETVYLCGKAEHIHDDGCYYEDGTLRCTIPEHLHTQKCEKKTLSASKATVSAAAPLAAPSGTGISSLDSIANGGSYYLTKDVSVSSSVSIGSGKTATLDLNGHKIIANCNPVFNITGGTLTITDSGGGAQTSGTVTPEHPWANLSSYGSKTLTYYVTETEITDKLTGATKETVKEYKIDASSSVGAIIGQQNGRAFTVSGGTLNIKGGVIANFKSDRGGAIYAEGGTINISGGVLSGNVATGSGGAIYIRESNTKVYMRGGYITNNTVTAVDYNSGGGGVMLAEASKFYFYGGYITGNQACGGGGVKMSPLLGNQSSGSFYMIPDPADKESFGGFLTANNSTKYEGGGANISAGGYLEMKAGYVTNNVAGNGVDDKEFADWGGGGIFCAQDSATVYIENALFVKNEAGGFGGGVAGCSTGRIAASPVNGFASFDNIAHGENMSGAGSAKHEDHQYAFDSPVFMSHGYQDYFCGLASTVSAKMLGGGVARWNGSSDGNPVRVTNSDQFINGAYVTGLTNEATDDDKLAAKKEAKVYFNGNVSPTHGGGILINGYLIFGDFSTGNDGKEKVTTYARLELKTKKNLLDEKGNSLLMEKGKFQFVVTDESGTVVSIGHNEASGEILFDRTLTFRSGGEFTYYLYELPPGGGADGIHYDQTRYMIKVTTVMNQPQDKILWTGFVRQVVLFTNVTITKLPEGTVLYDQNPGNDEAHTIGIDPTANNGFTNLKVSDGAGVSMSLTVEKKWSQGSTPEAVTVTLYKNGASTGQTKTLSAKNNWKATWNSLDASCDYTVVENTLNGYTAEYSYSYSYTTGTSQGPSNAVTFYKLVDSEHFIPWNGTIQAGDTFVIEAPIGHKLLYTAEGFEDAAFNASCTLEVGPHTETFTYNKKDYNYWFKKSEIDQRSIYIAQKTNEAEGRNLTKERIVMKCSGASSWLAAEDAGGNYFKGTSGARWASEFLTENNTIMCYEKWETSVERFIIFDGSKFTSDTKTSNIVYTTTTGIAKSAAITNTPIANVKYALNILKVDADDNNTVLPGAKFILKKNGTALTFKYDGATEKYTYDAKGNITELTVPVTGTLHILGLSSGSYVISETEAPEGYEKAPDRTVTIDESSERLITVTVSDKKKGSKPVIPALPETGGGGITPILILGALLVINSLAALTIKVKNKNNKNRERQQQ